MAYPLQDKYINLLTDFGFKRVFVTEPNKNLLIDFLNTLLPEHHRIKDVTFKNNGNLGNTYLDRKAIFDIYCQGESGEYFIVEIQKAKQNFFKDRSVYYSTLPIQEQAEKGDWNYKLTPVYTVGVLDFIFAEHKHEKNMILHTVKLKNQQGREEGLQEGLLQGREEGLVQGREEGREAEKLINLQRQQALLIRQLSCKLGEIPDTVKTSINQLADETLENLGEALFDFSSVDDLTSWLQQNSNREIS